MNQRKGQLKIITDYRPTANDEHITPLQSLAKSPPVACWDPPMRPARKRKRLTRMGFDAQFAVRPFGVNRSNDSSQHRVVADVPESIRISADQDLHVTPLRLNTMPIHRIGAVTRQESEL